jgi:hypothetical protein
VWKAALPPTTIEANIVEVNGGTINLASLANDDPDVACLNDDFEDEEAWV